MVLRRCGVRAAAGRRITLDLDCVRPARWSEGLWTCLRCLCGHCTSAPRLTMLSAVAKHTVYLCGGCVELMPGKIHIGPALNPSAGRRCSKLASLVLIVLVYSEIIPLICSNISDTSLPAIRNTQLVIIHTRTRNKINIS